MPEMPGRNRQPSRTDTLLTPPERITSAGDLGLQDKFGREASFQANLMAHGDYRLKPLPSIKWPSRRSQSPACPETIAAKLAQSSAVLFRCVPGWMALNRAAKLLAKVLPRQWKRILARSCATVGKVKLGIRYVDARVIGVLLQRIELRLSRFIVGSFFH
jgi:hypothetical protein